jgi:methionine salvage enolase-phosphatase E1
MERGWQTGVLQAAVYDDAVQALKQWHQTKTTVAIYSSGAISAQKVRWVLCVCFVLTDTLGAVRPRERSGLTFTSY